MTKRRRRVLITTLVVVVVVVVAGGLTAWRLNMWECFPNPIQGIEVTGDPTAPPTKWWNHLYLAWRGWTTVTVLEVNEETARHGYRVGYSDFKGRAMVTSTFFYDRQFRMKIGHEGCKFFVVNVRDQERPLREIGRTTINDPAHQEPLH